MRKKLKIDSEQMNILKALSLELDMSVEQIHYFIFDMGLAVMVSSKIWADEKGNMEDLINHLKDKMNDTPFMNQLAYKVYEYWKAGQNPEAVEAGIKRRASKKN